MKDARKLRDIRFTILLVMLITVGTLSACAKAEPITLAQVKTGQAAAQQYFDYLQETIPEIKKAKEDGLLKGIVFNPSEEQTDDLLKNLKLNSETISNALTILREAREEPVLFVVLPNFGVIGTKVPVYIVAMPEAINFPSKEADIETSLLHELLHVKDIYYGFAIDGLEIKQEAIDSGQASKDFIMTLGELRAHHLELELIFRDVDNLRQKYSRGYLTSVIRLYGREYSQLAKIASTSLEKNIASAQLAQYRDIRPVIGTEEKTEIEFNINGQRIIIGAQKPAD